MYAKTQAAKRSLPAPGSSHSARSKLPRNSSSSSSAPRPACSASTSSRPRPVVNPNISQSGQVRMMEEMREQRYQDSLCTMCSDTRNRKYHHHFSCASIRRMISEPAKTYLCPICKVVEPVSFSPTVTRRVVLSDSTLYGIWDQTLPKNIKHFDIDSIVGGKVRDMTTALKKNYLHLTNRFEILVLAGINNIGAGECADSIFKEVEEIKEVVSEHSKKWGHSRPSYVSVCTVALAPKFCSLSVPPNPPEPEVAMWVPGPNFNNKYDEIKKLNSMLIDMHAKEGLKQVRMDFHGVKRFKSGTLQHKFDTRPGVPQIWREPEVFRKLHFTRENKIKIIQYINTCFASNTATRSTQVPSNKP